MTRTRKKKEDEGSGLRSFLDASKEFFSFVRGVNATANFVAKVGRVVGGVQEAIAQNKRHKKLQEELAAIEAKQEVIVKATGLLDPPATRSFPDDSTIIEAEFEEVPLSKTKKEV